MDVVSAVDVLELTSYYYETRKFVVVAKTAPVSAVHR